MRSEADVTADLRRVRARRLALFPTQAEPLSEESPQPADYWRNTPGGEITELLEREAQLVVERAEIRRAKGTPITSADQAEEATARRILARVREKRKT